MLQWIEKGSELPRVGTDITVLHSTSSATDSVLPPDPQATESARSYTESSINSSFSNDVSGGEAHLSSGSTSSQFLTGSTRITSSNFSATQSQSASASYVTGSTSGGTTVIDASGNRSITTSYTESGSTRITFTAQGGTTVTITGRVSPTSTTSTTSTAATPPDDSSSSETATGTGTSTTLEIPAGDLGSYQTTSETTEARTYATYSTEEGTDTVLSTASSTESEGTFTRSAVFTIHTTSTVESHIPYATTAESSVSFVVSSDASEIGFAENTRIEPGHCCELFTSPGIDGISAFCDAYASVAGGLTLEQDISSTSDSATDDMGGSTTSWGYDIEGQTETDSPIGIDPHFGMGVPSVIPGIGYRPYSALSNSDPIYDSYTIDVAATCTNTDESTRRQQGILVTANFGTQVVTLNSEDSLVMGSVVTASTFEDAGAGGFPDAAGDISYTFSSGVYGITRYDSAGVSSETTESYSDSSTGTIARGEQWAVEPIPAFQPGGARLCNSVAAVSEISCGPEL
jgi:hypothetical protein